MDVNKYAFEPFEAAIALMTARYIFDHVSKAELAEIINPRVIRFKPAAEDKVDPVSTEIDAPKLITLLNDAKAWYQTTGRRYDDEIMTEFNVAVDQLIKDFDGEQYLLTEPVGFYQYLVDLYIALPSADEQNLCSG